jgi:hypothetical protein
MKVPIPRWFTEPAAHRDWASRATCHPPPCHAAASRLLGVGPSNSSIDPSSYARIKRSKVLNLGSGNVDLSRLAMALRVSPAFWAACSWVSPAASRAARSRGPRCTLNWSPGSASGTLRNTARRPPGTRGGPPLMLLSPLLPCQPGQDRGQLQQARVSSRVCTVNCAQSSCHERCR